MNLCVVKTKSGHRNVRQATLSKKMRLSTKERCGMDHRDHTIFVPPPSPRVGTSQPLLTLGQNLHSGAYTFASQGELCPPVVNENRSGSTPSFERPPISSTLASAPSVVLDPYKHAECISRATGISLPSSLCRERCADCQGLQQTCWQIKLERSDKSMV